MIDDETPNPVRWTALAAKITGTSHIYRSLRGQDHCCVRVTAGDMVLGALSDGVGSAKYACAASKSAVLTSLNRLIVHQPELSGADPHHVREICMNALSAATDAICAHAEKRERPAEQYACTLILIVVAPDWVAAMSVGDGFVTWRPTDSSRHQWLLAPESGEFINETAAIPDVPLKHIRFELRRQQPAFVLASSDGLEPSALNMKGKKCMLHSPFFEFVEKMTERPDVSSALLQQFLDHPDVEKTSDDDKSLIVVKSNSAPL